MWENHLFFTESEKHVYRNEHGAVCDMMNGQCE